MRWIPIATTLLASVALASGNPSTRPATRAEADFAYLTILNSTPVDEALQMLTDVGVDEARARELLKFLDEHWQDQNQQYLADTVGLCRNLDGRFSNPLSLARELNRQRKSEQDFQARLVRSAADILGVSSLEPVRSPHMKPPGFIIGPDVVDLVLEGQITPDDAIRRACEVTEKDRASVLDRSEAL